MQLLPGLWLPVVKRFTAVLTGLSAFTSHNSIVAYFRFSPSAANLWLHIFCHDPLTFGFLEAVKAGACLFLFLPGFSLRGRGWHAGLSTVLARCWYMLY
jgi:hypothetical protein